MSQEKMWGPEPFWGLGYEVLDQWNQTVNERAIANETKKPDAKGKRVPAEKLLAQAAEDEAKEPIGR